MIIDHQYYSAPSANTYLFRLELSMPFYGWHSRALDRDLSQFGWHMTALLGIWISIVASTGKGVSLELRASSL